jgi:hypothetical protein
MKTKIYKNRFCDLNTRPNPELLKDCFFPEEIKGLVSIYQMSYVEIVEETELWASIQSELDFINLINSKIYVISRHSVGFEHSERPYSGGVIMNIYLKLHYSRLYDKYKLLFDN